MADLFNYYIFDLDGTLIDTREDLTNAVNILRNAYDLPPLDIKTVTRMVGDGIRKLVERVTKDLDSVDLDKALQIFNNAYEKHLLDHTYVYSGMSNVLEGLKKNNKSLAVNTNKSDKFAVEILKKLGIYDFFDLVVGGDSVTNKKPDPEGILKIIEYFKAKTSETLMIGDGKNDILASKRAGIKSAYITYGYTTINDVGNLSPDYFITEPQEILFI